MNPRAKAKPFLPPCAADHLDGLRSILDFEWSEPPVKLAPGWLNRQRKRLDRIAREITELDARILAADREKAARIGREIEHDLEMQAESDLRLQQLNSQRADLQADAQVTAKWVNTVTKAVARQNRRLENKLRAEIYRDQMTIARAKLQRLGKRVR